MKSWLLTTDHKRIAILYMISITVFFFLGGSAAALIRYNLLVPEGMIRSAETYNRLFTMHGIIMVWFFLVPAVPVTIGNFVVPLMLGARDLAFPKLNLVSWYLFMAGGFCALYALFSGGVDTGWTFYTPLSSNYAQGHVVAVVIGIFISGFSTIATGLNFIITIHRLRAPGLTWYRLPVFIWSLYSTSIIFVLATPVLAITLLLLLFETLFHVGVFDPATGWRPAAVPAFVLVLLASRGLHHDPARPRHRVGDHSGVRPEGTVRLQIRRLGQRFHRGHRVFRLGPPHVRLWTVAVRERDIFHVELFRRRPVRHQGLQLARHAAQGPHPFRRADDLCAGLHRPVHHGRHHRPVPGRAGGGRTSA